MAVNLKQTAAQTAAWNASKLSIRTPTIELRHSDFFLTKTTMAACREDGKAIAVNTDITSFSDVRTVWLAISHEVRHCWQIAHDIDLSSYAPASNVDTVSYNSQEAEFDAMAWSFAVMQVLFGVAPTLEQQLGAELCQNIVAQSQKFVTALLRD